MYFSNRTGMCTMHACSFRRSCQLGVDEGNPGLNAMHVESRVLRSGDRSAPGKRQLQRVGPGHPRICGNAVAWRSFRPRRSSRRTRWAIATWRWRASPGLWLRHDFLDESHASASRSKTQRAAFGMASCIDARETSRTPSTGFDAWAATRCSTRWQSPPARWRDAEAERAAGYLVKQAELGSLSIRRLVPTGPAKTCRR